MAFVQQDTARAVMWQKLRKATGDAHSYARTNQGHSQTSVVTWLRDIYDSGRQTYRHAESASVSPLLERGLTDYTFQSFVDRVLSGRIEQSQLDALVDYFETRFWPMERLWVKFRRKSPDYREVMESLLSGDSLDSLERDLERLLHWSQTKMQSLCEARRYDDAIHAGDAILWQIGHMVEARDSKHRWLMRIAELRIARRVALLKANCGYGLIEFDRITDKLNENGVKGLALGVEQMLLQQAMLTNVDASNRARFRHKFFMNTFRKDKKALSGYVSGLIVEDCAPILISTVLRHALALKLKLDVPETILVPVRNESPEGFEGAAIVLKIDAYKKIAKQLDVLRQAYVHRVEGLPKWFLDDQGLVPVQIAQMPSFSRDMETINIREMLRQGLQGLDKRDVHEFAPMGSVGNVNDVIGAWRATTYMKYEFLMAYLSWHRGMHRSFSQPTAVELAALGFEDSRMASEYRSIEERGQSLVDGLKVLAQDDKADSLEWANAYAACGQYLEVAGEQCGAVTAWKLAIKAVETLDSEKLAWEFVAEHNRSRGTLRSTPGEVKVLDEIMKFVGDPPPVLMEKDQQ